MRKAQITRDENALFFCRQRPDPVVVPAAVRRSGHRDGVMAARAQQFGDGLGQVLVD